MVFFKLVLVGGLENLVSARRLVEHSARRLDVLWLLGDEVDEGLPWHSTVSRIRQLFPAAVFERLFDHGFAPCVARGLVAGDTQAVDSAPIKAHAKPRTLTYRCPPGRGHGPRSHQPRAGRFGRPSRQSPFTPLVGRLAAALAHE